MSLTLLFCLILTLVSVDSDKKSVRKAIQSRVTDFDKETIRIPGDFVLGAIFPSRSYGGKETGTAGQRSYIQCGELEPTFVIQAEAFRLSIEYVNKHVLKGYTFGGLVEDECDNAILGLQSAVRLMAGEISKLGNVDGICHSLPKPTNSSDFQVIYGMTGGTNSIISERVAPLFEVFCLTLISTYATAAQFENENLYKYFLRTVPQDTFQARAVFDILKEMKWYSVIVVHEKTAYGEGLLKAFNELVNNQTHGYQKGEQDVCITEKIQVDNVSPDFEGMAKQIESGGTNVIILFVDFTTASQFFQHMKKYPSRRKFQYVGTDAWSRTHAAAGVEDVIADAITTEFLSYPDMPLIKDFIDNLTMGQVANSTNPWLKELISKSYNCTSTGSYCENYPPDQKVEIVEADAGIGRAYYVFESVYAYALAFEKLRKTYCTQESGICPEFYNSSDGTQLMQALKEVRIVEPSQLPHEFEFFNGSISGPPIYSVFQFRTDQGKKSVWQAVGNWSLDKDTNQGMLNLDMHGIRGSSLKMKDMDQCRKSCTGNSIRDIKYDGCCWKCKSCTYFQYIDRSNDTDQCAACEMGQVQNAHFDGCIADLQRYPGLDLYQPLFIIFLIMAAIGFVAALGTAVILIRNRATAAAELAQFPICVIGTLAIAALFACSALTVLKPTDILCLAQWSVQPFLLTLVIGVVFVHIFRMPRDYLDTALTKQERSCATVRMRQVIQMVVICTMEISFIVFCTIWFKRVDDQDHAPNTKFVHIERDADTSSTTIACSATMDKSNVFILFIVPTLFLCISLILASRRYKSRVVFKRRENRRVIWASGLILILFIFVATPVFATVVQPWPRVAVQMATLILCSFILLFFVYIPIAFIMLRGRGNTWLHLTRDVKEDERITSDQLNLSETPLREGCFCAVYRGTYRKNAKQVFDVAAKKPKPLINSQISQADLTDTLLQELTILRHLRDCEHIVKLFGVCNDSESITFVFEYMTGGSCRHFVPSHRGNLTVTDLISIGACIADALCFLKEKSIVHRDIKAENCLVQEKGAMKGQHHVTTNGIVLAKYHAKLADFGLAVEANAGRVDFRRQRLCPARHTPPEGFYGRASHESDIWSFGIFLWELFTLVVTDNAVPFEGVDGDAVLDHLLRGNILDKPQVAPLDVYETLMKPCWTFEPSKRIDAARLKQLLLNKGRKVSGDKANGAVVSGLKAMNLLPIPTPDILNEQRLWTTSPSVSSNGSSNTNAFDLALDKPAPSNGKREYKTPSLLHAASLPTNDRTIPMTRNNLPPVAVLSTTDESGSDEDLNTESTNSEGNSQSYVNLSSPKQSTVSSSKVPKQSSASNSSSSSTYRMVALATDGEDTKIKIQ